MKLPQITLKPGKDAPVRRFHPWIFSGAIQKIAGKPGDGDVVEVLDAGKNRLATGHYHEGSIAVKLFAFGAEEAAPDLWLAKLRTARAVREQLALTGTEVPGTEVPGGTTSYRLVHGEGDGFPGLIIDYYDGVVVLQAHSIGMHREREHLVAALRALYGTDLRAVYDKSRETLPDRYAEGVENGYLFVADSSGTEGIPLPHPVLENGHTFLIDWETGQKTGFFLDQRDNRALLARYAPGRRVLNAFCYSGGFSIYALAAGAELVHSVDASQKAIDLTNRNVDANTQHRTARQTASKFEHRAFAEDVTKYLKTHDQLYDLIILDPPAYAKSLDARHRAVQGYKRLNAEGLKRLAPGGILFTFSCSQVVDRELFYHTVVAAALEAGRAVRVLHQLTQAPDHPVNFFHPEGSYLKGLVLYVE
jgi:23S rRNA (cytosine1962-C5)-methyltransferase